MGRVTAFAPVHTNRGVFVQEGAPLIDMALQTSLLVIQTRINEMRTSPHLPGRRVRSMRIVAVRTRHETFIDPVLGRKGELRSHVVVTAITDVSLALA